MPLLRSRRAVRRTERRVLGGFFTAMVLTALLFGLSVATYYLAR